MTERRKIPEAVRLRVADLAGHRCSYCRSPEIVGIPMLIDHIIPLSAGGTSDIDNLCLACYRWLLSLQGFDIRIGIHKKRIYAGLNNRFARITRISQICLAGWL